MSLEYRNFALVDVTVDSEKRTIVGRSLPYNSLSNKLRTVNGDTFNEVILPGAIDDSLKVNDIMAFAHHKSELILGRLSAGTLRLDNRADGLYCEISVPATTYGNDLLISAARGDLNGFSFGFQNLI
jgi:HK97 family phage prohead protease